MSAVECSEFVRYCRDGATTWHCSPRHTSCTGCCCSLRISLKGWHSSPVRAMLSHTERMALQPQPQNQDSAARTTPRLCVKTTDEEKHLLCPIVCKSAALLLPQKCEVPCETCATSLPHYHVVLILKEEAQCASHETPVDAFCVLSLCLGSIPW